MSRKLFYLIALLIFIPGLTGCPDGAKSGPTQMSLFAGNVDGIGSIDALGSTARFHYPSSMATDSTGNFYVADSWNHTIRKITPAGVVTTLAGKAGVSGTTDATGVAARFDHPTGVATDSVDNLYVADSWNQTIRKITPAGVVTTLAGAAANFFLPLGVATDSTGNVYVADSYNHTIRKITPTGVVTTLAGTAGESGATDATGAAARFFYPQGVATDSADNVYVADTTNSTIRKITPAGDVTTLAGTAGQTGSTNATGAEARFYSPSGVATDSSGNVYVTDASSIRKITPAGVVTTLAGAASPSGSTDAIGTAARFNEPKGITIDSAGYVFVADTYNNTIRKITSAGDVTTLAGTAGASGATDAAGAAARFKDPNGIATDSAGNVYVADTANNTIRKITPAGVVTTLAGMAVAEPQDVAAVSDGNIYVSSNHTIRKISPAGVVTTLAGTAGQTGSTDATGVDARFDHPTGVATDSTGNVYVADTYNSTIRKITPAGDVTTLAGAAGASGSTDATGALARFSHPQGVATDNTGNVYVTDFFANTIRKITPAGVVTTLAGAAGQPGSTDGAGTAARFKYPNGIATDSTGNVYVADTYNNTIRKITPAGVVTTLAGTAGVDGFMPGDLPGTIPQPKYLAISGSTLYLTGNNGVIRINIHP